MKTQPQLKPSDKIAVTDIYKAGLKQLPEDTSFTNHKHLPHVWLHVRPSVSRCAIMLLSTVSTECFSVLNTGKSYGVPFLNRARLTKDDERHSMGIRLPFPSSDHDYVYHRPGTGLPVRKLVFPFSKPNLISLICGRCSAEARLTRARYECGFVPRNGGTLIAWNVPPFPCP